METLESLHKEIARLKRIIEIEQSAYRRLAICSGHAGKANGLECVICQAERHTREEVKSEQQYFRS